MTVTLEGNGAHTKCGQNLTLKLLVMMCSLQVVSSAEFWGGLKVTTGKGEG